MKHAVIGIFRDSKRAGNAISELKTLGYTKDISVLARDVNKEGVRSHQIKEDLPDDASEGAGAGSVIGGGIGALVGLLSGAATFAIPGLGIAVVGPIATGLMGAGAGGGAGALIGALVDMGVPKERALEYQDALESGEVLVLATIDAQDIKKVEDIIATHQDRTLREPEEYGDYAVYHYQYAM